MTNYCFEPPPVVAAPVVGSDSLFPVRRILCVGRNYAAHRREMGGDDREPPFFFAKPADALVVPGLDAPYPSATDNLHHEIELVVALSGGGVDIAPADALALVFGYAAGIDLTRRDIQSAARSKGYPWDAAKGFDHSAPIGLISPADGAPPSGAIRLTVNGEIRQDAHLTDMIWSVPEIIAEASKLWRLAAGDLIFTGTPEGVGPLLRGDRAHGEIEGVGTVDVSIT